MRLTKLILLLAALLLLLPGTALAEPQEQLFLRQVSVGSFDVWQHTDGRWQDTDHDGKPDPYGLTNKTLEPEVFTLPQTQYTSGFTVTRVEIEYDFTLTDEGLKNAGRSESWDYFNKKYLTKLPNNYKAEKTGEDLAQGEVTVQKTLDLTPELLDLKDPAIREELGMSDQDFSDLAQGWRWYTPVLINWYGVPKDKEEKEFEYGLVVCGVLPNGPDSSATPGGDPWLVEFGGYNEPVEIWIWDMYMDKLPDFSRSSEEVRKVKPLYILKLKPGETKTCEIPAKDDKYNVGYYMAMWKLDK
ncbi:hypothetical protein [Desulfoscipio gibsoniae]|uniref:Uncharacterized protein n=1 Tax=Desulfoscipio gibsoniae DSM 7213 TaxID=767817 RepID=R4KKU2_9FIRM|nr:hypothetical protein [Desulfoscipio gibsoniae]AGL01135.1 hypothetical protein Desgi_1664 [Desulfoscipio gibsoniae DSM 7213]